MADEDPDEDQSDASADDGSIKMSLEAVSAEVAAADCEQLAELGIYSIHDQDTARTITLPEAATAFDDATMVKQYYFEGADCPLLVIAPMDV